MGDSMKLPLFFTIILISLTCVIFQTDALYTMKKEETPVAQKDQQLIEAAKKGNNSTIMQLLFASSAAERANINATDSEGMTALLWAAKNGRSQVLNSLVESYYTKLNINARNKDGATALILASENGHSSFIRDFSRFRPEVDARTNDGSTALIKAAMNGHLGIIKLLIESQANPNLQNSAGISALIAAAINGRTDIVQYLINTKSVNIDEQDTEGRTALIWAAINKYPKIVKILLHEGALWELCDKSGLTARDIAEKDPEIRQLIQTATDTKAQRQKQEVDNFRRYRNLIIIVEYGANEILGGSLATLDILITALKAQCAFILIPAPLWDHFLHAQQIILDETSLQGGDSATIKARLSKIDAKAFFDKDQWEMYKICLKPQMGVEPHDQKADFYLLSPKIYKQQILAHSPIPEIREKLPNTPIINTLPDLGIELSGVYPIEDPLAERGDLGLALDTLQGNQRKDAISKIDIDEYQQNKLLDCLQQILTLKKAHQTLIKLRNTFEEKPESDEKNQALKNVDNALFLLPQYNVYIDGHGGSSANLSTEIRVQLQSIMDRAQKLGYVPSAITATEEQPQAQEYTKIKSEREQLKRDREKISPSLGTIAGIQPRFFGEVLEFFNGITNFFFVSTCHGAGIHLVLPFVFMNSPQTLSYTLATTALLDAPTSSSMAICNHPDVHHIIDTFTSYIAHKTTGTITYNMELYDYAFSTAFRQFFDGVSNFPAFIKNEEHQVSRAQRKTPASRGNYFAHLLNYVGNFLDNVGHIRKINNVPWVKLPGNTPWQVISTLDHNAFFITDTLIRAKLLEEAPIAEGQRPLGEILEEKLRSKKPPVPGKWICSWCHEYNDKSTMECQFCLTDRNLQQQKQPPIIKIPAQKDFIFISTRAVPLTVHFGKEDNPDPISIIPIGQSKSLGLNETFFNSITTDYDLTTFYKKILKPVTAQGKPLFEMPENTLFFIKDLTCKNGTFLKQLDPNANLILHNCIVVFNVPGFDVYDVYCMINNIYFGIKSGTSKKQSDLDVDKDIKPVDINEELKIAFHQGNMDLVKVLIKAGANAATLKAKDEQPSKFEHPTPKIKRSKSLSLQTQPETSAQDIQRIAIARVKGAQETAVKKEIILRQHNVARACWHKKKARQQLNVNAIIKEKLKGLGDRLRQMIAAI
jgi:ankyrin repeat protein